ncbi:MAG TPA: hypothetical protein PK544_18575 [Spirochaetota bacterium]|nr:hypothetical protein [Spirochaetota bacterium]
MKCHIPVFIIVALILIASATVLSHTAFSAPPEVTFKIGAQGSYGSGISESNITYKPFGDIALNTSIMTLRAGIAENIDYQILDGYGNYDTINTTQGKGGISLYPFKAIEVGAEYRYTKGGSGYISHDIFGEAILYLGALALEANYNTITTEYEFDGVPVTIDTKTAAGKLSFTRNDWTVEGGYEYQSIRFDTLDYDYTKNLLRLGIIPDTGRKLLLMAGAGGGGDSADYTIFSGDVGLIWKITSHLRLKGMYIISYYSAPDVNSTTSTKSGKTSASDRGSGTNPFLESSLVDQSYTSQNVTLGMYLEF